MRFESGRALIENSAVSSPVMSPTSAALYRLGGLDPQRACRLGRRRCRAVVGGKGGSFSSVHVQVGGQLIGLNDSLRPTINVAIVSRAWRLERAWCLD